MWQVRRICSIVICAQIEIIKYTNSFLMVNPKEPKSSKEAHLEENSTHLCAQLCWLALLHLPKRVRNAVWIPGLCSSQRSRKVHEIGFHLVFFCFHFQIYSRHTGGKVTVVTDLRLVQLDVSVEIWT